MATYTITALAAGVTITALDPVGISAACVCAESAQEGAALSVYKQVSDTLVGTASMASPVSANRAASATAVTSATLTSSVVAIKSVLVVLSEAATLNAAVTPNAVLNLLASESGAFTALLVVDGEEYVVWVSNADTFAHSQYAGFNFNSMCRLGDHYYGAKADGIYTLEGSDDAGTDIQWFVTLPTTDFGTAKTTRVPKVYMGFSNSGDMRIKVITREGIARVYAFGKTSEGYSESGAAMGRGVKSRYFTFDFYNVDGGDVELDHIEFFPVTLARLMNS